MKLARIPSQTITWMASLFTLHLFLFTLLHAWVGTEVGVVGTAYVVAAGWWLGVRGGALAWVVATLANVTMMHWLAGEPWSAMEHAWPGAVVMLGTGLAAGWARQSVDRMRDQARLLDAERLALREEISARAELQNVLQRLNEELAAARDRALAAERARQGMINTVTHELRTPLAAIMGYAELVQMGVQGVADGESLEHLRRMQCSGEHMAALINDLLDLSKIESGNFKLRRVELRIPELVRQVEQTARPLAQQRRNQLEVDVAPDVPRLLGDPTRLRQILLNLVGNACKFTEAGTISVRVWSQENELHMQVRDTGVGMSDDVVQNLFQEFFQARPHSGSSGLGLAITRKLCDVMGGSIDVQSMPGQGSTFLVRLPLSLTAER